MPSARIIKAVDVLKERDLHLPPGPPLLTPDQLSLHGLEEGFDHCVRWLRFLRKRSCSLVAITFTAHRHYETVLA
jgi:hypothetical protein